MALTQNFSFGQNQAQAQKLVLTQGMRQSILVLQLDTIDLAAYLQDRSLGNPLFDVKTRLDAPSVAPVANDSYQIKDTQQSLFDYLLEQVQLTMRKTPLRALVVYLIEQLDPRGYLPVSNEQIKAELGITDIMLADAMTLLQRLDPPGVGAHDLQECLLLQAQADEYPVPTGVIAILTDQFANLTAGRFEAIQAKLALTASQLKAALNYIRTLSADPGLPYNHTATEFVVPDLRVHQVNGKLSMAVIKANQPRLVFAEETYAQLKDSTDREVQHYLKEKLGEYQSLTYSLARREETLSLIGRELVKSQYAFFMQEQKSLAPLLLRDIAQRLQLAESTVSRAINGKYLQTDFGVMLIKSFFSRYSAKDATHSVDQIQTVLASLIAKEDKTRPLSDDELVGLLHEQGLNIARRTVAKYRAGLQIPVARKRKQGSV